MNLLFNIMDLNELLHDFYVITGIRIVIFDDEFHEIASYPKEQSTYCSLIRADSFAESNCILSDKKACQICKKQQHLHTYTCHAGLTESVTPINAGGIIIGYIMFGQVSQARLTKSLWLKTYPDLAKYNINLDDLYSIYKKRPVISEEIISSAARTMEISASYLYLSRKITLCENSLPLLINTFISDNIKETLTVSVLCIHFSLSKSMLYQVSAQYFGMGIAKHIRYIRLQKALILLSDTNKPIYEVANDIGMYDYNYFSKIFKKHTGLTPKVFRNKYSN